MKKRCLFFLTCWFAALANAQQNDSLHQLKEVLVTATRIEKSIGKIPVPILVITQQQIKASGAQNLAALLQEQTGIVIAENPLGAALQGFPNPFGQGVQLQGLDAAYTQILLDGEPLIGRNGGVLNLSRIAVGNIQQIEIIKGPAASLYGSDALAGVINIVTNSPQKNNAQLLLQHGSNGTWLGNASLGGKKGKIGYQLFGNYSASQGYDLDSTVFGQTVDPSKAFSLNGKLYIDFSAKTQLTFASRWNKMQADNRYETFAQNAKQIVSGQTVDEDWSAFAKLKQQLGNNTKLIAKLYATGFSSQSEVFLDNTNALFDRNELQQFLLRPELLVETGKAQNQWFFGLGTNQETIAATRYANRQYLQTYFAFAQKEWWLFNRLSIAVGLRMDAHNLYATQWSPKLSAAYTINNQLKLKASAGYGFKTPDFRQLFLNYNSGIVGYTLLGANELGNSLQAMKQNGLIDASINISNYANRPALLPERSFGVHFGISYQPWPATRIEVDLFRNDINNLIDRFTLPFVKTNGQSIFSYQNNSNIYTQGIELNWQQQMSKQWQLSAGYQLLLSGNKADEARIDDKKVYRRDPQTFVTTLTKMSDYGGLFNRSRHSANLQLRFQNGTGNSSAALRINYRSGIGYSDVNGNALLDDDREYITGFALVNFTVSQKFCNRLIELQAGANNLFNYTNVQQLPGQAGRTIFMNLIFNFTK
jgi:outer membrane receptor for ferrienterochelin and colicins